MDIMEKCENSVAASMAGRNINAKQSAEHLRILCEEDRRRHDAEQDSHLNIVNLILPLLNDPDYLVQ